MNSWCVQMDYMGPVIQKEFKSSFILRNRKSHSLIIIAFRNQLNIITLSGYIMEKLTHWEHAIKLKNIPWKWTRFYCTLFYFILVISTHEDVINWKHFPLYWPFVMGIHRSPVATTGFLWRESTGDRYEDSPRKGPVMGKTLTCHDVIMFIHIYDLLVTTVTQARIMTGKQTKNTR